MEQEALRRRTDSLATANRGAWSDRADACCDGSAARSLFRNRVSSGRIGTNVDSAKLIHFRSLVPPRLVSTHAVRAAADGDDHAEERVCGSLPWGRARHLFESAIGSHQTVVYGTLDLPGCPGVDPYGPYRLVYEPAEDSPPWVLPHNSALAYGMDEVLRELPFAAEVATWDRRGDVAVARRTDIPDALPENRWPPALASECHWDDAPAPELAGHDLVEVVTPDGARNLDSLTSIRISAGFHRERAPLMTAALGADTEAAAASATLEDEARLLFDLINESGDGGPQLEIVEEPT